MPPNGNPGMALFPFLENIFFAIFGVAESLIRIPESL